MSQVSPDGKFVVNSIDVPHAHGIRVLDRLYNGFYPDYGFGQVFYPTRGVLAWYSKDTGKLQPLPGADDPAFVQTSAFWVPTASTSSTPVPPPAIPIPPATSAPSTPTIPTRPRSNTTSTHPFQRRPRRHARARPWAPQKTA